MDYELGGGGGRAGDDSGGGVDSELRGGDGGAGYDYFRGWRRGGGANDTGEDVSGWTSVRGCWGIGWTGDLH